MNWCQPHWDHLRAAIQVRGLDKFGAQNVDELKADIEVELAGEAPPFDPLMTCFWRINTRAMSAVGLRSVGKCPFCLMIADGHPELVDTWIIQETDGALQYAIAQGLVKVN